MRLSSFYFIPLVLVESFQQLRVYSSIPDSKAVSHRILKSSEEYLSTNAFYTVVSHDAPTKIEETQRFYRPVTLKTKSSGYAPSFATPNSKDSGRTKPHHSLRLKNSGVDVMDLAETLKHTLSYLCPAEQSLLDRALAVALLVHVENAGAIEGRRRVERAARLCLLLGELEVDIDVLCAAILIGTVTPNKGKIGIAIEDIDRRFGSKVATILQSYEHTAQLEKYAQRYMERQTYENGLLNTDEALEQIECLRNLILSEVFDWRVVVLLVAVHLRKMRYSENEDQFLLAYEALNLHGPLAHRLGFHQYVSELQSLAFKRILPNEYSEVRRQVAAHISAFESVLDTASTELTRKLKSDTEFMSHVESIELTGRVKEPYSMWKKMKKDGMDVSRVQDAVALRIILKPIRSDYQSDDEYERFSNSLCYRAMEIVKESYPILGYRFKDYISNPKRNGYQSLHATALIKNRTDGTVRPFEVQVRTTEMHQQAEYGIAAHWSYKGEGSTDLLQDFRSIASTSPSSENGHNVCDGSSFVTWLSNELRAKKVFVFGPDGLIWDMDKSATAADIARLVSIKNFYSNNRRCPRIEIMVEGNQVPFDYLLRNGDCISVMS